MARKKVVYKLERYKWPDEIEREKARNRNIGVLIVSVLLAFFIGGYSAIHFMPMNGIYTSSEEDSNLALFQNVYQIMRNNWYFGKDIENLDEKLIMDAIDGMMQPDVDLHTYYMNMDSASNFISDLSGKLVGIGATVLSLNGDNIIERIYRNSPAETAGLQPGDVFLAVDGVDVSNMTTSELVTYTRGVEGTEVEVLVRRGLEEISFKIIRKEISTAIYYDYIDDEIAYLEISSFADKSEREVEAALKDFVSKDVTKLIIDLRDNGGGYLDTYKEIANLFLPYNTVSIQQENKNGNISKSHTTNRHPYEFDKIVLLVNGNTASAAEVFAAAMRESIGAVLVGTNTYGKGTVQLPQTLFNGGIMKYTTNQWLTTNGNKINGVGLAPDYEVVIESGELSAITMEADAQFEVDMVSEYVLHMQKMLRVLGYDIDREDGYFSLTTENILKEFESDNGLKVDGVLDQDTMSALLSSSYRVYFDERTLTDIQKQKAIEIINESI